MNPCLTTSSFLPLQTIKGDHPGDDDMPCGAMAGYVMDFTASAATCGVSITLGESTMTKQAMIAHLVLKGCCGTTSPAGKCDAYKLNPCKNAANFLPDALEPEDDHSGHDHGDDDHGDEGPKTKLTCSQMMSHATTFTPSTSTCAETDMGMEGGKMGNRAVATTSAAQFCCSDKLGVCDGFYTPVTTPVPTPVPTGTSTVTQKVVHVTTISGLDYNKVIADANTKAAVVDKVKDAYLHTLGSGYSKNDLAVVLSSGSVKATVTVTPKSGVSAAALSTAMSSAKSSVEAEVVEEVKSISGVSSLLETGKTLNDISATSTTPTTITDTSSTNVSGSSRLEAIFALLSTVFVASQL
jgi:hypothetical protein